PAEGEAGPPGRPPGAGPARARHARRRRAVGAAAKPACAAAADVRAVSKIPRTVMRGHSASEDARRRAYDPRIHPLGKKFAKLDGLHRNSGLPELRSIIAPQVG